MTRRGRDRGRPLGALRAQLAVVRLGCRIAAATMLGFGGEDPLEDPEDLENWHHRRLSHDAAIAVGWTEGAAREMSWHTDYVDSYLYNPLWWMQGGLDRLKAALSLAPTLTTVHFDDLTDLRQIQRMWHRYRGGMMAGVMWAARSSMPLGDRVAAARHIAGVALHPFQDFYSHSNWVDDPQRRNLIFTDPLPFDGDVALYTGNYEQSPVPGIVHHGRLAPECSVLRRDPGLMEIACHAASPLTKTPVCEMYRACREGVALGSTTVYGVPVPAGLVYLAPPGIALDSHWVAPIGTQVRGFPQADADLLFTTALALAERQSTELLCGIARAMTAPDLAVFWDHVRQDPPSPAGLVEAQFEEFHRQGSRFIGTGPYPPDPGPVIEEWFLRLRLVTSDEQGAGTDADIYAGTDTSAGETLLDNMPDAGPALAYDDFETGDDQVFHLGPFLSPPGELVLRNDAADLGDVFESLGRWFVTTIRDAVYAIGDLLLNLIGGHADQVATEHRVWTPAQLSAAGDGPSPFSVLMDGGDEGVFRVHGEIRRTARGGSAVPLSDWAVRLDRLECIEESDVDRGSDSDEPFLIAMLVNQASRDADAHLFGPYDDVDTGESRALGREFVARGVPDRHGHLTLALQLWESDDEGSTGRQNAFEEFTRELREQSAPARDGFLDTLGRALASAWTLERVEITTYGFAPDGTVWCGPEQTARPGTIEGGTAWRHRLAGNTDTVRWAGRGCGRESLGRLDLDASGTSEILVASPWGLGALAADGEWELTSLAMAPNGTDLGGWLLNTAVDRFGPSGGFRPGEADQVWVRGPGGLACLRSASGGFTVTALAPAGKPLDGWEVPGAGVLAGPAGRFLDPDRDDAVFVSDGGLLVAGVDGDAVPRLVVTAGTSLGTWDFDPRTDRIGPCGDFDGDGYDELVIAGPRGLGLVSFAGGPHLVARIDAGADFGLGAPLDPEALRLGPAADLRGVGRRGLLVTTPGAHGFLELDEAGAWRSRAYASHGTAVEEWDVDVTRDRFGPVGHLHTAAEDVWLTSPSLIGVLTVDGHRLRVVCAHPVGEMFDDWRPTIETRYSVGRPVRGEEGLVLAANDWGMVLISARDDRLAVRGRAEQGVRLGGWLVDTRVNAFQ